MSHFAASDPDETPTRPVQSSRSENPRSAEPVAPALIGGRYRLDREIASGGFGVVYEGHYKILDQERRVAIKLMKPSSDIDSATLDSPNIQRFEQEIRTLTLLKGSNICEVIDGGVDQGALFLVMEYADGGSLKQAMQKSPNGRIAPRTALRWLHEAAQGLLAAETNKREDGSPAPVYHRDVKPENLLLQDGHVVVADFGAARLGGPLDGITSENVPALWTPRYASPEQAIGVVDHRSDIYSLGTTFYHLLTGQPPDKRFSNFEQRYSEAHDPSRICSDVPKALGAVVRKMTEPNPAHRYQSFAEVVVAVEELMHRRAPAVVAWIVGSVVVAAALLGGAWLMGGTAVGDDRDPERTLAKSREIAEQQFERVRSLLEGGNWERLEELRVEFERLRADLGVNRQKVQDAVLLVVDADRVVPLSLPQSFRRLEKRWEELNEQRNSLLEVRRRLEHLRDPATIASRSIESLRRDAAEAWPGESLKFRAGLVELRNEIVHVLEEEAARREQAVEALARDFVNANELALIVERANALVARLRDQREADLERRVGGLVTLATEAQRADPLRPFPDGTLTEHIDAVAKIGDALAPVAERSGLGERERVWWRDYRNQVRRQQLVGLRKEFEAQVSLWEASVREHRDRPTGARTPAARHQLEEKYAELERCRQALAALYPIGEVPPLVQAALLRVPTEGEDWRQAFREECERTVVTGDDPDLTEAFAAVAAARDALRAIVQGSAADLNKAAEASQALAASRRRLDAAARTLTACRLVSSPEEQEKRSCADLIAALGREVGFSKVDAKRAEALRVVGALELERRRLVRTVREAFGAANDLQALAAVANEATRLEATMRARGEKDLADAAQGVGSDAAVAKQLFASLPAWDATRDADAAACLQQLVHAGDALLEVQERTERSGPCQEWWIRVRDAAIGHWCSKAIASLTALRDAAAKSDDQGLRDSYRARLDDARRLRTHAMVGSAMRDRLLLDPLPEVVPVESPRSAVAPPPQFWPPGYAAPAGVRSLAMSPDDPDCSRIWPAEVLKQAQAAGVRLWYFDKRRTRPLAPGQAGRIVLMAFVKDVAGRAWLVDVHPVTFGELLADQHGQKGEFRDVRLDSAPGRSTDEQLAHFTSHAMAMGFAGSVTQLVAESGTVFELPPKACYEVFARFPVPPPAEPLTTAPWVEPATADPIVPCYLLYTCRGVREWDRDGEQNGPRFPNAMRDDPRELHRKWNTGLRLVVSLNPLASEKR